MVANFFGAQRRGGVSGCGCRQRRNDDDDADKGMFGALCLVVVAVERWPSSARVARDEWQL